MRKNFYIKSADVENRQITFGYSDENVVSEITCLDVRLRNKNGSILLGSLLGYDDSYFAELANQQF